MISRDYVSSLVEEGRPSALNIALLAREDHIAVTKIEKLGITNKPIDRRLIGFDSDREYKKIDS